MGKPQVMLLGVIDHAHNEWLSISSIASVIIPTEKNRTDFIASCKAGKYDEVVACYRTFASVSITGLWDEDLVKSLPERWKWVAHNGAGYDQIDIHACSARGIRVSNVPTAPDDATADTNMFLILGALRGFNTSLFALRSGHFKGVTPPPLGHDPQGKVLGILGMGGIGRNLMKKAAAFGMKTQYYNRKELSQEFSGGAKYVGFEELLRTSDVLSLNLPLNKQTRHIISTPEFALMKDGIVIINTARGAVMNEAALVEALDSGKVWSCGLDVYEEEPKVHEGLLRNPNVMLIPHMGTWTVETQTKMEKWCIDNLKSAVTEGKLMSIVPEQADL